MGGCFTSKSEAVASQVTARRLLHKQKMGGCFTSKSSASIANVTSIHFTKVPALHNIFLAKVSELTSKLRHWAHNHCPRRPAKQSAFLVTQVSKHDPRAFVSFFSHCTASSPVAAKKRKDLLLFHIHIEYQNCHDRIASELHCDHVKMINRLNSQRKRNIPQKR